MDCLRRLGGIEGGAGPGTQLMNRKEGGDVALVRKSQLLSEELSRQAELVWD